MVYHYTSIDSLRCLIESVKKSKYNDCFVFRATNILYMNDPEEFLFGQKIFNKTLRRIEKDLGIQKDLCFSNESINYPLNEEWIRGNTYIFNKKMKDVLPYVISFSTLEDSLPMWLNYGDGGKGVCMAFLDNRNQPLKFRETPEGRKIYESFYTSDVHYDKIKKNSWLYQTLFDIVKDYKEDINKGLSMNMKDAYYDALVQISAPFIKTKYYENEHEVRIAKTIGYDYFNKENVVEFRCNIKGNIIPFIGVEIPISQLAYIILGPLSDFRLTHMAFDLMTDEFLKNKIDIRYSNVQYRNY